VLWGPWYVLYEPKAQGIYLEEMMCKRKKNLGGFTRINKYASFIQYGNTSLKEINHIKDIALKKPSHKA